MATTAIHALPTPDGSAIPDVPSSMKSLADAIDNVLPVVTTSGVAPTSPATGQLWYDTSTHVFQAWDGTEWAVTQPPAVAARVSITASYSLVNGAWTQITGGAGFTVDFDPHGLWNASSSVFYTTSYPGLWRAHARVSFPTTGSGSRGISFAWSSANFDQNRQVIGPEVSGDYLTMEVNTIGQVSGANQYVRLMGYQNSGAALPLGTSGEFSVEWLGPLA